MTRQRENNKNANDAVGFLLQKAKKEFFAGKISQAAYLWEKALEKAPEDEEALACRTYVRKNSIALRAVAMGKDIEVPPPPVFLEREDECRGKSDGARRFSSTEDLEWSDFEEESPGSQSVSQGEGDGERDDQSDDAGTVESGPVGTESEVDEDSVLLPSLPELEGDVEGVGEEDIEGEVREVGEDVGKGDYAEAAERDIVSQPGEAEADDRQFLTLSVGRGAEDIPKPSTTLSGMPTSRLLPKDLLGAEDVTFSSDPISVSGVDTHGELGAQVGVKGLGPGDDDAVSAPEDEETIGDDVGEAQESHPYETPDSEGTGAERTGMNLAEDPEEHVVKMSDRESEALLDPEKGLVVALELFEGGKHAESLKICELLEEQLVGNEDVEDLIEQNREILERFYIQRLGGLDSVPRVELGAGNLQDMHMDHKTAFLLTRIDGMLTIDDVMSIAGMSRLETAKMLIEALERGIIVID